MKKKQNLVFFFADQQRADTIGVYGQRLPVTPNLDSLAQEGVVYESAFTCQPVCGPARGCLQSGLYSTQCGCIVNGDRLNPQLETLAKVLNNNGYQTAYVGKWHLASDTKKGLDFVHSAVPEEYRGGYKYWRAADVLEMTSHGYNGYIFGNDCERYDFVGYRADCITDFAIEYLHNRDKNRPFMLFLSHIEPHHQNDRNRFEGPDGSKGKWNNYDVPQDLLLGQYEGDWKENYPDYLGQCNSLDYNLGRIIDTLKSEGVYNDTTVIYTSDHGCHFRTRDGEYKRMCHDSCLHIPLIIKGRDFEKGVRDERLVSLINLPATVLRACDAPVPSNWAEKALQDNENSEFVYYEISEIYGNSTGRGIRTKRYTYSVLHKNSNEKDTDRLSYVDWFLYDNENDPYQSNNLINDTNYAAVRQELCEMLSKKLFEIEGIKPNIKRSRQI